MIEDLCSRTGLFMYIQAGAAEGWQWRYSTPRSLPELKVLILLTTVFINSFVVYTRVLSYNEGHEASL